MEPEKNISLEAESIDQIARWGFFFHPKNE
jgi:hypothetical protein